MNRYVSFLLLTATLPLIAAEDGRAIITELQSRARVQSQQYTGVLTVVDASGKSSEKGWTYERLGSHGKSKVVIRFTRPAEVKGVAILVVNYPDRTSEQWMWTPAINRERRIATQDRATRFFGTDFSFEDLEERDVEQFDYRLEGEELLDGEMCWKVTAAPRASKHSQYKQSIYWVRKSNYTHAQIENYTAAGLARRLKYTQLANVQGIWTPRSLEVEDGVRKSRTTLRLESINYNLPLSADQFTVQALRRGF
jgi:allantoicase